MDPHKAVDFLIDAAPQHAQAKATRVYLESFLKSKKAILMKKHVDLALGAQEREALADPEYIALLDALRGAVEEEETIKWKMTAAQTRVDVWRSQESSARAQDRATQ
jgi:hypothetical protein